MNLRVAFLPRDVPEPEKAVCVVIDVLRATSTLATMLHVGCRDVVLEPSVAEARASGQPGRLLCGEEGGLRPAGFDHGNSPVEFAGMSLAGRAVTFATTNGTKALQLARRSPLVLAGSIVNGPTVATYALAEAEARGLDLQIVCAGRERGTSFALDDAFCAGYLVELLVDHGPFGARGPGAEPAPGEQRAPLTGHPSAVGSPSHRLHDSALGALRLFRSYRAQQPSAEAAALAAFGESTSGRLLASLGLGPDVAYCARPGLSPVVPRAVVDGAAESRIRVVEAI